jgi:hypothetical protein
MFLHSSPANLVFNAQCKYIVAKDILFAVMLVVSSAFRAVNYIVLGADSLKLLTLLS